MITRILLLLLGTFVYSFGIEDRIYWDQCSKTTDCYIRESCIEKKKSDATAKTTLTKLLDKGELSNGECDVVIQIRAYGAKYQIKLQVNANYSTVDLKTSGVVLKQGNVVLTCKETGPTVDTSILKIVDKGQNFIKDKIAYCSFTVESVDKSGIADKFSNNLVDYPTVEFTIDDNQKIEFGVEGSNFWTLNAQHKCNPELLSSDFSNGDFSLEKIDNFAFPPIGCDPDQQIIIDYKGTTYPLKKEEKLGCSNEIMWRFPSAPRIKSTDSLKVACGERFCSKCSPLEVLPCDGCKPMESNTNNGTCMIATCPADHQWRLDGDKLISGEMECKKEAGSQSSKNAFWYLNGEKVDKAACVKMDSVKKETSGGTNGAVLHFPIVIQIFILACLM